MIKHILLSILVCPLVLGQTGDSLSGSKSIVWGSNHFIEYHPGDLPIIISVPHDGYLKPDLIADRTKGVYYRDSYTQDIAKQMSDALYIRTGKRPYIILNNLHRKKLDPNREMSEAAQGHPIAETAWTEYHAFIDTAESIVQEKFGRGIYIDLHGHANEIQRIELGYGFNSEQLDTENADLDQSPYTEMSTLTNLLKNSTYTNSQLLRDTMSFGAMLEKCSIRVCPSPQDPKPRAESFYSGGYSVIRHARDSEYGIFGFQIEMPLSLRSNDGNMLRNASLMVDALIGYLNVQWKSHEWMNHEVLKVGK